MIGFPNPFSTSCGQRPPYFAGRIDEDRRFRASLNDLIRKKPRNLAFVGDYGIGKTSLLLEFCEIAQKNYCASIFLPCRRFADELGFYNFLLQSIRQAIPQSKWKAFSSRLNGVGFSLLGSGVSLQLKDKPADLIWGIAEVLEQTYSTIQQPLVILIDDFQDLVETTKDALQTLKQAFTILVAKRRYPMMLVAMTSATTFKELKEPYDPIARFFEPRKLPPLSREEVDKAVNVPLEAHNWRFNDTAVDRIFSISEGRPYYVQLCAYYALERASAARAISEEDVERGLGHVINQLAIEKYDRQFENASENERIILKIVADYGPISHSGIVRRGTRLGIKESTVKMAVKRLLEEKKYIARRDSKYCVFEEMFKEFLKARATS